MAPRPRVFFDITIGGEKKGKIVFELVSFFFFFLNQIVSMAN